MTKIETKAQYDWAVKKVEELLPLVTEETPLDDPNSIELELLSNLVADYSEEHFALGEPSLVDVLKLRMFEIDRCQSFPIKRLHFREMRTYFKGCPEYLSKIRY